MQKKDRSKPQETQGSNWEKEVKKQDRNQMIKKYGVWVIIAIIAFIGLAGLVVLADRSGTEYNAPTVNENVPAVSASKDIIIGNKDAKVAVIKYSDFQCPACASYNSTLKQIESNYPDDVMIVYRMFPIESIHQNAIISGQAAWAAWQLGKFSEMKDELYANQNAWQGLDDPEEEFAKYAVSIGLDEEEFTKLMNSTEAEEFVKNARNEAVSLGITATPTFFIGKKEIRVNDFNDFKQYIDDELGGSSSEPVVEESTDSMEEANNTDPTLPPLQ